MKKKNSRALVADVNKLIAAYSLGAGAAMVASPEAQANIIWSGNLELDFGASNPLP